MTYKVCVRCFTFNHVLYIEEALNGFCMQETKFPFVCTIVDDASTDGEQEVIKKYLQDNFDLEDKTIVREEETADHNLTFARHKTNRNCFFAVLYLKYNHYSIKKDKMPYIAEWHDNVKYIALCEGDDYWIDSHKLQQQVDFLENQLDYSCCVHEYKEWIENTKVFRPHQIAYLKGFEGEGLSFDLNDYVQGIFFTKTLTALYRREALDKSNYNRYEAKFDMPMFYALATQGLIYLMNQTMGVYRINDGGVTSKYNWLSFCTNMTPKLFTICKVENTDCAHRFVYNEVRDYIFYFVFYKRHLYYQCLKYLGVKYNAKLILFDLPRILYNIIFARITRG